MQRVRSWAIIAGEWLATGIYSQLFLLLVSWPILLWWGLPISLLALVGNIVFSPIITLFLMLCALLFFTELTGLPNGAFIFLLETLSDWWVGLLGWGSPGFLFKYHCPSVWLLLGMVGSALVVIYSFWGRTRLRAMIYLLLLLVGFTLLLW